MVSEKKDDKKTSPAAPGPGGKKAGSGPKIVWDSANIRSAYANVFNVSGAREEFVFFFGMNQAWDAGQNQLKVQLTDRVIMSPFAAKRLSALLNKVIEDYEAKFGTLDIESASSGDSTVH